MKKIKSELKPFDEFLKEETKDIRKLIFRFYLELHNIDKAHYDLSNDIHKINLKDYQKFRKIALKSIAGSDISLDLGYKYFYNIKLKIKKGIYIPQYDTEGIVEIVLKEYKNLSKEIRGLEIGTGTGAMSIAICKNNTNIKIDSIDKSRKAINLAKQNILSNNVEDSIELTKMDILKNLPTQKYDFIISNPPYIDRKSDEVEHWVKKNQPKKAIYTKHEGIVFYSRIFEDLGDYVKDGGFFFLEIGEDQKGFLEKVIQKKWKKYWFKKDLSNKYRYLIVQKI